VNNLTVINTSPLIFLSKAGLIDLLKVVNQKIIVPTVVKDEIFAYGKEDITAQILAEKDWLIVKETPPVPTIIQNWDLGKGESEVLAWGYIHKNTEVIIDDLAGRRCALALSIPVRGTLGLVLLAKKRGVIPLARPILEQLRLTGMYLSSAVINLALAKVGE
jgi:predicted nucleic acid-binding protein